MLSFVNWLTLSGGAEQSGLRGPSTENQEAKQAALLCIKVNLNKSNENAHECTECNIVLNFFTTVLFTHV